MGAAVGHMGADRSPAAEELHSRLAEAGSLLEAGIPGSALVGVGCMTAVADMEGLVVGGTGCNRAEKTLLYHNYQFSCQGEGK